jgi:hypothetical protein
MKGNTPFLAKKFAIVCEWESPISDKAIFSDAERICPIPKFSPKILFLVD